MKPAIRFVLLALSYSLLMPQAYADTTIVILRHGEKPARGLGQLTCQGFNRALALAPVLLSRYGSPQALYAPNPAIKKIDFGIPYAYIRPLATIEPLAIRIGLPVNLDWAMTDTKSLSQHLLAQAEGVHIIAWEHHYAEKLAKELLTALGGNPEEVPNWNDADFDSLLVIRVTANEEGTKHATFSRERQGLNGMPEACDK